MRWTECKEKLPKKDGRYMVIRKVFGKSIVDILKFSTDLYHVDHYEFQNYKNKNHAGFYEANCEYGYDEVNIEKVLAWAKSPKIPDEYMED